MRKILSVYVNLQDEEINIPKYLKDSRFIVSVCPASITGGRLSKAGIEEVSRLLESGCLLGQRGYEGRCRHQHDDGTDPWHENFCLYNPPLGLEQQLELMSKGQKVLEDIFGTEPAVYAPINHLFDENTVSAALVLNYSFLMDQNNFGIEPYEKGGIVIVPEAKITDKEAEKSAAVYCHVSGLRERKAANFIKKATLTLPLFTGDDPSGRLLAMNEIKKRIRKYERDMDSLKNRHKIG